jgi:hypothetical protein
VALEVHLYYLLLAHDKTEFGRDLWIPFAINPAKIHLMISPGINGDIVNKDWKKSILAPII